jgi:hypothetical protein
MSFVPDDVAPRYVKAGAALKACDAGLGIALYSLIDSVAVPHGSRWPFLRVNRTGDGRNCKPAG